MIDSMGDVGMLMIIIFWLIAMIAAIIQLIQKD